MFDTADPDDIPRCSCCPRALSDADYGRLACVTCERRIYAQLNDVGTYWDKLPDSAQRPVVDRGPGRSMSVHPGMPGNAQVINLTAGGGGTPLGKLIAVEDDWRIARGYPTRKHYGRPITAMPEVLKFLRDHLPWACGQHKNPPLLEDGSPLLPDVHALSKDLGPIVGELKHAATGEPRPRPFPAFCWAELPAGGVCPAQIWVNADTLKTTCAECGATWDRGTYMRMAAMANQFGAAA